MLSADMDCTTTCWVWRRASQSTAELADLFTTTTTPSFTIPTVTPPLPKSAHIFPIYCQLRLTFHEVCANFSTNGQTLPQSLSQFEEMCHPVSILCPAAQQKVGSQQWALGSQPSQECLLWPVRCTLYSRLSPPAIVAATAPNYKSITFPFSPIKLLFIKSSNFQSF